MKLAIHLNSFFLDSTLNEKIALNNTQQKRRKISIGINSHDLASRTTLLLASQLTKGFSPMIRVSSRAWPCALSYPFCCLVRKNNMYEAEMQLKERTA